jgi:hypothetical protein
MFQTKVTEKFKTQVLGPINFFPKILPFMRKCGKKHGKARQVTDDDVIRKATEIHPEYLTFWHRSFTFKF